LDEEGQRIEGGTKNQYSRREIELTPAMFEALKAQKAIHHTLGCEYLFCTPNGCPVHLSNLRRKVWIPTLKEAGLIVRALKQTRHTFATLALGCGEDPNWIASVMGHCDTQMIFKHYTRYVKGATGVSNGTSVNAVFQETKVESGNGG